MEFPARPIRILVSAGEASGDMYAARLVHELRCSLPQAEFFGCAGVDMQAAGVEPVVDAASLSVVGLVEVLHHIPRIYGEFRKLERAARERRPDLAILTDSPDFHLRLAPYLRKLGVPVLYLVAPQAWAWRKGRVRSIKRNVNRLACIFPFEEEFFRNHGVRADYIGHPLARTVRPGSEKEEFVRRHGLAGSRPVITLLPGSRAGEIARHMQPLMGAVLRLQQETAAEFVLAAPAGFSSRFGDSFFNNWIGDVPVRVIEGETWDAIAHADLALAASGTVTIETALLGTPMVTFYKVTGLSWWMGRFLVNVPFYSMVNLVAGKQVVPELMQADFTAEKLAKAALPLLEDPEARSRMKNGLACVAARLAGDRDPMQRAAEIARELIVRT
jgi:lipid-A-disaccharide synthase